MLGRSKFNGVELVKKSEVGMRNCRGFLWIYLWAARLKIADGSIITKFKVYLLFDFIEQRPMYRKIVFSKVTMLTIKFLRIWKIKALKSHNSDRDVTFFSFSLSKTVSTLLPLKSKVYNFYLYSSAIVSCQSIGDF